MKNITKGIRFRNVYIFLRIGLEHGDIHCRFSSVSDQHVHSQEKAGLDNKKQPPSFSLSAVAFCNC